MFATTHVLAGALVGRLVKSPVPAFAAGLASHVALDVLPHWGVARRRGDADDARTFRRVAVVDGVVMTAAVGWLARRQEAGALAGAIGGVTPDLNKPAELVGLPLWGRRLNQWHGDIQRLEAPGRWPVDVAVAAAAVAALRLRRRP